MARQGLMDDAGYDFFEVSDCSNYESCREDAYNDGYEKGRADVLREHQEQCNGKCFKCEIGGRFIDSDGEEVILPYSYSYKTDCEDMRYIKATEVKFLLDKCRADALGEIATRLEEELTMVMPRDKVMYLMYKVHTVFEQLKEQRK